jgi:hypothetical protein
VTNFGLTFEGEGFPVFLRSQGRLSDGMGADIGVVERNEEEDEV